MVGKERMWCLPEVKIWSLWEKGMMVDVWRVWGNWAVCSSEAEAVAEDCELAARAEDSEPDEVVEGEEVVRVVSHSPICTLYSPSDEGETIT
jgi:hypothetical protein